MPIWAKKASAKKFLYPLGDAVSYDIAVVLALLPVTGCCSLSELDVTPTSPAASNRRSQEHAPCLQEDKTHLE